MKAIILAMLLTTSAAYADTITLGPQDCGTQKQCVAIPNDAGADVALYANPSYKPVTVYVDGVQYASATGNGMSIASLSLTGADGSVILLTASFTTYRTCTHSGRGQYCLTHYQLAGGSIER